MQGIAQRATMEMEATLSHSITEFNKQGLHTEVSTYIFGSTVRQLQHRSDVLTARAPQLTGFSGGTALYDAITVAVSDAKRTKRNGEATLLLIFTDGHPEGMQTATANSVKQLLATLDDSYTVTIAGPSGNCHGRHDGVVKFARSIGIHDGNVALWDTTDVGTQILGSTMRAATTSYSTSRAGGSSVGNSKTFYEDVTTDLSGVDTGTLSNLSANFILKTADKEAVVEEFVAGKMKKPFINGQAYYQLVKKEKVDPSKQVLVRHRKSGAIYGGVEARKAIGLPTDGRTGAKVNIGNNAWFDIFLQSTHGNRILPRGSQVLIDKTMRPEQALPDSRFATV